MLKSRFLILLLPLLALLFSFSALSRPVEAGIEHNIRGLASSSAGFISFNCLDDDFFGRFPMIFPFYFNITPCSLYNYGVHLEDDNTFSGSAWSPALGFFHFDSTDAGTPDPPNYDFNVNCLSPCTSANNCLACYNYNDQRVYGWAYREVPGDWVRLDSGLMPPVTMTNFMAPQPGIFSGYASSAFSNISFNCLTEASCGSYDYKVYMWKLELQEMSAPNWSFAQACSSGAQRVVFQWVRKSGFQSAYRVIVNTNNNTSSPIFDTGKVLGSASQLVCPGPSCAFTPQYGQTYYWWLQLWNATDEPTEWFQFNRDTYGVLTDNITYNDTVSANPRLTFTSYLHEFPNPFFTWDPPDILVNTTTDFTSDASYYTSVNPNSNPQSCADGSCDFLWEASNPASAVIASSSAATTTILFTNTTPQVITLSVTDSDDYMCSYSSPVLTINYQLPLWKEVKAE